MPIVFALRGGAALTVSLSVLLCLWPLRAQDPPGVLQPPAVAASDQASNETSASDAAALEPQPSPAAEPPLLDPAGLVERRQRDAMVEDILSLRGLFGAAFSSEEEAAMFRQALESFEPPPAPPVVQGVDVDRADAVHVPDAEKQGPLLIPQGLVRQTPVIDEVAAQLRTAARMMDEEAYRAAEEGSVEAAVACRTMATRIFQLSLELPSSP